MTSQLIMGSGVGKLDLKLAKRMFHPHLILELRMMVATDHLNYQTYNHGLV